MGRHMDPDPAPLLAEFKIMSVNPFAGLGTRLAAKMDGMDEKMQKLADDLQALRSALDD